MAGKQFGTIILACAIASFPLFAEQLTDKEIKAVERTIAKAEAIIRRDAGKPRRIVKALFDQAEAYERVNEWEKAREGYEKIISMEEVTDKQLTDAQLKFIEICYELDDAQAASPVVRGILDNPDVSKMVQRKVERMRDAHVKPGARVDKKERVSFDAMVRQGEALVYRKEYDKAMELFQRVIDHPGASAAEKLEAHSNRGYCYYVQGQYDKAVDVYTATINDSAIDRQNKERLILLRADCYMRIHKEDLMLQDLNNLIQQKSHNVESAYVDRGYYYYKRKRMWDEALNDFTAAYNIPGSEPDRKAMEIRLKGEVYLEVTNYEQALSEFDQSLSMEGVDDLQKMMSLLGRADTYMALKDFAFAKDDYLAVLLLDKQRDHLIVRAYQGLAKIHQIQGDDDALIKDYTGIIEMDPPAHPREQAAACLSRAHLYLKRRDVDGAISDCSKVEKMQDIRPDQRKRASSLLEKIKNEA